MQEDPPEGWVELVTRRDWERVRKLGGYIVISDDASDRAEGGPKYHRRGCRAVTLADFTEKVLEAVAVGRAPNGRYFWVATEEVAASGGARACKLPNDPMYTE